ncbi:MAG: PhoH family protein [Spirochaetaceae bacterium]|nr:MAG: PhoH family protein [Spirochaetaceae bacterium]
MSNPEKIFVIDTNVFIHRPDAILSFRDNEIVIPLWVLEELDNLKKSREERGRNARESIRLLDELSRHGDLKTGVKMENGSTLKVWIGTTRNLDSIPVDLETDKNDNKILLAAYTLQQEGKRVFFVSKDISARLKATALGIKAVDYEKQKVNIDTLYKGYTEMDVGQDSLQELMSEGAIPWNARLVPNEFVVLRESKSAEIALSRYDHNESFLQFVPPIEAVCGVRPLNRNQEMALNLLLDDSISLVTLVGKAGTGKTLLALAAGLNKALTEDRFSRVLLARPIIPMGKDIGYLPGDKIDKLANWMQPVYDNLEYILSVDRKLRDLTVDQLINRRLIEIEALTYIRGRSLPNQFIIIDEAQNLSPHEVKTIVSRAGTGTKVVLTGDPYQIDTPYLDANSNGLTFLVEAFKGQEPFGHVTLEKSERSPLAEMAAELL